MRKLLATKHNWKYPKSLQEAAFKKGRMNSALSVHRRLCKNPLIQIQDISGLDKPNFVCYTEETGQQLDGFSHPRQSSPHMPHSSLVSRRQRLRKSNPKANFRVRIFFSCTSTVTGTKSDWTVDQTVALASTFSSVC